jgi:hypothetical protein
MYRNNCLLLGCLNSVAIDAIELSAREASGLRLRQRPREKCNITLRAELGFQMPPAATSQASPFEKLHPSLPVHARLV